MKCVRACVCVCGWQLALRYRAGHTQLGSCREKVGGGGGGGGGGGALSLRGLVAWGTRHAVAEASARAASELRPCAPTLCLGPCPSPHSRTSCTLEERSSCPPARPSHTDGNLTASCPPHQPLAPPHPTPPHPTPPHPRACRLFRKS